MMEDIIQRWTELQVRETGKGERPDHIMETFRTAVEEVAHHRYHIEPERPLDFDDHVEQREHVVNEAFDDWSQGYYKPGLLMDEEGNPMDLEQISKAIDAGKLGERGPEHDDFIRQELLEPAPLNFSESIHHVADYLREKAGYMRERAAEFIQGVKDTFDTFGR